MTSPTATTATKALNAAGLARIGGEAHRSPPRYRANDPVRRQALAKSHQHPLAQTQFAWAYGGLDAVPHHGGLLWLQRSNAGSQRRERANEYSSRPSLME